MDRCYGFYFSLTKYVVPIKFGAPVSNMHLARMAELVDALVSGTSIERCGGSSPLPGTIQIVPYNLLNNLLLKLQLFQHSYQVLKLFVDSYALRLHGNFIFAYSTN